MRAARWLTALWFVVTLIALGWPASDLPQTDLLGVDKVVHAAIFFAGTILALSGWSDRSRTVILLLLAFAPLAELWQLALPTGRSADPFDAIANAVGVALGWLFLRIRQSNTRSVKKHRRQTSRHST